MRLCHPALRAAQQFDPVAPDVLIEMGRGGLETEVARREPSPTTEQELP
jgi:hypothetical protein